MRLSVAAGTAVLLASGVASANRLAVRVFTFDHGLAGDSVTALLEDSRGLLWVGTTDGLSVFDGTGFVTWGAEDPLVGTAVTGLAEGPDGRVWVLTASGLATLGPGDVAFGPACVDALRGATPVTAAMDASGRLWLAADRRLLVAEADAAGVRCREVTDHPLPRPTVALAAATDGTVWAATTTGLLRFPPSGAPEPIAVAPEEGADRVRDLRLDAAGRLWIVHSRVLLVWWPAAGPSERKPLLARARPAAAGGLVPRRPGEVTVSAPVPGHGPSAWRVPASTPDGGGWAATAAGVVRLEPDGTVRLLGLADGLPQSSPTAILVSRDGLVWVGTEGGGLERVDPNGMISFGPEHGLLDRRVASILDGRDGALYVTSGGGSFLHRLDGDHLTGVALAALDPPPDELDPGWRHVTLQDADGWWWRPTASGLLGYAPARLEELAGAAPAQRLTRADGLGGDDVHRVYEDRRGDLWIATDGSEVLSRRERATGRIVRYGLADGLPMETPTAFAEDAAGNLWIGLDTGGLVRFDGRRFERVGTAAAVPPGAVNDLLVDHAGGLWAATARGGVARSDDPTVAHPSFVTVSVAEGLTARRITCLAEDGAGRLWLGSALGVDRYDPVTGRVRHFGTRDGLANAVVTAAHRDRAGRLWFGTLDGLSCLNPANERERAPPAALVAAAEVDGQPLTLGPIGVRHVSGLVLPATTHTLALRLRAGGSAHGPAHFQHRLDDGEWSSPAPGWLVLAGLRPGRHRIEVRAVDEAGEGGEATAAVDLVQLAPLWRRGWFQLLAVLGLVGAVLGAQRVRLRRAVAVERMRTRIATDLHDDLGTSLAQVSVLAAVVARQVPTDSPVYEMLQHMGATARGLLDSLGDVIWAVDPRRDDLRAVLTRLQEFGSDLLEGSGVAWRLAIPDGAERVVLEADPRRQLFLLLKEAVGNAARHGEARRIEVDVEVNDGVLRVVVKDDGRGLERDPEGRPVGRPGGRGLGSMADRAAAVGGTLELAAGAAGGSRIELTVPLYRLTTTGPLARWRAARGHEHALARRPGRQDTGSGGVGI